MADNICFSKALVYDSLKYVNKPGIRNSRSADTVSSSDSIVDGNQDTTTELRAAARALEVDLQSRQQWHFMSKGTQMSRLYSLLLSSWLHLVGTTLNQVGLFYPPFSMTTLLPTLFLLAARGTKSGAMWEYSPLLFVSLPGKGIRCFCFPSLRQPGEVPGPNQH